MRSIEERLDVVGVGVGPSNLSLAALLEPIPEIRARFFDRREELRWHPGLLFAEAEIQVSHLKDLVTPVDPTSRYSFLSFLKANGRLYRFIHAGYPRVRRLEFDQYLRWVAAQLPNLELGTQVNLVTLGDDGLVVHCGARRTESRHLVLGTGLVPRIPDCAVAFLGETVFHSSHFLERNLQLAGRRVAVVGGGQSGAEVVARLLSTTAELPGELYWISRRPNLLPLDETPFANELFTPSFSDYFFSLPQEVRDQLVTEQKLASDGISSNLLEAIYRRLYDLEFLEMASFLRRFWIGRELCRMEGAPGDWHLEVWDRVAGTRRLVRVDVVILCTGYVYKLPSCLGPIAQRIAFEDGRFRLAEDFSILWDGPAGHKIYVQNAARSARGIADPNLGLLAWRSSKIVNSLVGRSVYEADEASSSLIWSPDRTGSR